MQIIRKNGATSNVIRRKLRHSTTGQGLTGLTISSGGLIISTIADNEASATTYTAAGSTIETIATLGTFATPTATKCRFKEVDSTNHPGLYEFQFADARFAVSSAKTLRATVSGATNLLEQEIVVQLTAHDLVDSAQVQADMAKALGTAVTLDANNVLNVSAKYVGGTLQTAGDIPGRLTAARAGYIDNINNSGLSLLRVFQNGAVPTFNRGYLPAQGRQSPWQSAPAMTYYVRDTGNDSNDGSASDNAFLTLQKAIDQIAIDLPANSKIDIAGTITTTSNWTLPANCWLSGDGSVTAGVWSGTTILSSSQTGVTHAKLSCGDNCYITGIKLIGTAASGQFQAMIGYGSLDSASRNVTVRNCWIVGDSDGAYFNGSSCNGWWKFHNSILATKWDAVAIIPENATHVCEFTDSTITATGPSGIGGASDTRPIAGLGGFVVANNCTITGTGHATGKLAYGVSPRGTAYHECNSCTISGSDFDVQQSDRGTVVLRNCTLVNGTTSGNVTICEDGLDWSRIRKSTSSNVFSGSTISTSQAVASVSGAVGSVTGAVGSVTGAVGSVTGAVGSVTAGVALTSGERSTLSALIEAAFVNEADATAFLAALFTKINTLTSGDLASTAIAAAVRTNLTTELGRLDVAVSSVTSSALPLVLQTTTIATLASQKSFTLTAGSADNDAYNNAVAIFQDASTSTQKAICIISDYVGSTKTVSLLNTPVFTIQAGDTISIVASTDAFIIAPYRVDKRVWTFNNSNQTTAPRTISENIGFVGALRMDFTEPLESDQAVGSVSSASFANIAGTEPTITEVRVSGDKKSALVFVNTGSATAGTYTATVTALSTDNQTVPRSGRFSLS